jgi:membrane protease YdiL (CAAX protease family)
VQGKTTGLQIAFLAFAVILLSAPVGSYIQTGNWRSTETDGFVIRVLPFAIFALLLLFVLPMGRQANRLLSAPVARKHRAEVAIVSLSMIPLAWATLGARTLWTIWADPSAAATMKIDPGSEERLALSARGFALLIFAVVVAPVLEELLFRGFLYRAFERDWGWIPALVATSVIFGIYHPFFLNAFVFSLVLVCLLRRTGSLRATVAVHAFSNLVFWWPVMGRHLFPDPTLPADRLSTWALHFVCLAIATVVLPVYIWMSRDREVVAATVMLEPHASIPK